MPGCCGLLVGRRRAGEPTSERPGAVMSWAVNAARHGALLWESSAASNRAASASTALSGAAGSANTCAMTAVCHSASAACRSTVDEVPVRSATTWQTWSISSRFVTC